MRIRTATTWIIPTALLVTSLTTPLAQADTLLLENGDRLSGQLQSIQEEKLTFKTPYAAKPVAVPAKQVKDITAESPYRIRMANGETISGQIHAVQNSKLFVGTAYKDELALPIAQIAHIEAAVEAGTGSKEADKTPSASDTAPAEVTKTDTPASPGKETTNAEGAGRQPKKRDLWEGSVSVGGNKQSGNTERTSASVEVSATRKTDWDEIALLLRYNYAEEEGELTARDVYGEMTYKYDLTRHWFWELSSSLLADEFRDLDLRTTAGLGLGYRWLRDSDRFALTTAAGLTYISRNYQNAPDETSLAGRLSAGFEGELTDSLSVFENLTLYPSLEGGGHIVHNEVGLKSQITKAWHLKISHVTDYNSEPPAGLEDTDTTLTLGLGYNF